MYYFVLLFFICYLYIYIERERERDKHKVCSVTCEPF